MTTATKAFPWDHFLEERARKQVEGFRRVQWPNIKRELSKVVDLPAGLEPCWVAPGRAIYWQQTTSRVAVTKLTEDGREYRELEDYNRGFEPTGDLPANNPNVIAYYLKKGLLLRPPGQEVVEEEDTAPQDEATQNEVEFICYRHGTNRMKYRNWKAYIQHLARYSETPEYDLPPEVAARAATFEFYCPIHDRGFKNRTHAGRHRQAALKKPGKSYHPSLDDMRIEANA